MRASGSESNATQPSWPEEADFAQRTVSSSAGPCSLARIATRTSEPSRGAVAIGARLAFGCPPGRGELCRVMPSSPSSFSPEHGVQRYAVQDGWRAFHHHPLVMAGLVPAIHAFLFWGGATRRSGGWAPVRLERNKSKTWMAGTIPGSSPGTAMTNGWRRSRVPSSHAGANS
jgi:hypothetical protein